MYFSTIASAAAEISAGGGVISIGDTLAKSMAPRHADGGGDRTDGGTAENSGVVMTSMPSSSASKDALTTNDVMGVAENSAAVAAVCDECGRVGVAEISATVAIIVAAAVDVGRVVVIGATAVVWSTSAEISPKCCRRASATGVVVWAPTVCAK